MLHESRGDHSPKVALTDRARLSSLRFGLKALNRLARWISKRDDLSPHLIRGRCGEHHYLMSDSVSHPAPMMGLSFAKLFEASARHISRRAECLEIGAGAGIWTLSCLQRGAVVTASDLPGVDLSGLEESARRVHREVDIREGDLFESVRGRRFDHIFFNPPFHLEEARDEREQAYFGGAGGEVVRRYLTDLSSYLSEEGIGWLILPEREWTLYQDTLSLWKQQRVESLWLPLLGRVSLWALTPLNRCTPSLQRRSMNPVSECFLSLSQAMNTHSCEVLTLAGQIDELRLNAALETTVAHQLLTRSVLIQHRLGSRDTPFGGYSWYSQHPTPSPNLKVEELSTEEEEELSMSLNESGEWRDRIPTLILDRVWDRAPLNPLERVPFEFRLLRGRSMSLILIIAPHLCTDAFAGTLLLNHIAAAYAQGDTDNESTYENLSLLTNDHIEPDPLETARSVGEKSSSPWPNVSRFLRGVRGIIADLLLPGGGVPVLKTHGLLRGKTRLLIKRISAPELKAVIEGARARGVKAHTLFTWGFARALDQWSIKFGVDRKSHLRIADLCTLRPFLHEDYMNEIDLLVQPYTHTIRQDWSEEEALQQISASLSLQKREGALNDLARSKIYRLFPRILPLSWVMGFTFRCLFKTNVTTTNPGPALLRFSDFGEAEVLEFINFPQIAPPAELGLIYTTYRGELRLITLYDESRWEEGPLRELVEGLWREVLTLGRV